MDTQLNPLGSDSPVFDRLQSQEGLPTLHKQNKVLALLPLNWEEKSTPILTRLGTDGCQKISP